MKVVLLERIEKLGAMGDITTVKDGFARNYLLPQKKALRANKQNIAYFESMKEKLLQENLNKKSSAEDKAAALEHASLAIIRQAGDNGHLYGSVTTRDIAKLLTEKFFEVDRHEVVIDVPVKEVGLHTVKIRLHPEVVVPITLGVAQTEEEAMAILEKNTPVEETAAE